MSCGLLNDKNYVDLEGRWYSQISYHYIRPEVRVLRKYTNDHIQSSQWPDWDMNQSFAEYISEVLPLRPFYAEVEIWPV